MEALTFLDRFNLVKDILNLLLQAVGLFFVVQALRKTAYQIKHSEKTHADTLEWNKRIATENILEVKPDREVTEKLDRLFHTAELKEEIEGVVDKAREDKQIERDIHHLLNVYERLARGMKNGIYVESLVKEALRNTFIKVYTNYYPYIKHRQDTMNKEAWVEFEKYAVKWKQEAENDKN